MIDEIALAGLYLERREPIPDDETEPQGQAAAPVLSGVELVGDLNTPLDRVLANMRQAIRRGHPQARIEAPKPDRVCLVGGGPSLDETLDELRELYLAGAKIVALNGALAWLVARNFKPSAVVVLDARPSTARFVAPNVPGCLYYVASQCDPAVFDAVEGRERVAVWHSLSPDNPEREMLDRFYGRGHWLGVAGGTTVASRALSLLRASGYLRFDLFGVDSCWIDAKHHAYDQVENQADQRVQVSIQAGEAGEPQTFECAAWHVQQLEDFLQMIRVNGHQFRLNVHGRGLLASALRAGAVATVNR